MDCNFTTIKTCELQGSTFRSRILDFGNFDISGFTFKAIFKNQFSQKISEINLTALGNVVEVPFSSIENLSGNINVDVWMEDSGGFRDKVIEFDLRISTTGCPDDSSITDGVSVTFGGMKVPVVISQSVVNIYLDYENLTPEQQLALTGPKGDTFTFVDMTEEDKEELRPAINISQFNHITGSFSAPNFSWPTTGWNSGIREIGNIIEIEDGSLIFLYTGNPSGDYTSTTIHIGALQSFDDGETWTDLGKITEAGFEDPYLVNFKDEYYLYSEKKSGSNHLGINLHKGSDLFSLVDMGVVLGRPETETDWDFADRSSPAVIVINDQLVMFFEGRSGSQHGNPGGAIGRATSTDGINWSVDSLPLVVGYTYTNPTIGANTFMMRWASHLVPDDITYIDGKYIMTAHAYNSRTFACALLISEDLLNWRDATGTWITTNEINNENSGNGVMLHLGDKGLNGYYIWVLNSQFHFFKGAFANNALNSYALGNTGYKISPAGRNEYLDYSSINSNRTQTLAYDENSAQGVVKFLKNPSVSKLTLSAEEGVTIDGLPTYEIQGYREVCLICSAPNTWKVWSVIKTANAPEDPGYTPWIGTQAEYDALIPESGTIYYIT